MAAVDRATLDAMVQVERLHWRGVEPDALFLIDRRNDSFDGEGRVQLRESYHLLYESEKSRYPVHRIQNDDSVDRSVDRLLAAIRDLVPDAADINSPDRKGLVRQQVQQLSLPSMDEKPPSIFTKLVPARPTVVYSSYWQFAAERQEVFFRKIEGFAAPWTNDPIIARHKFTNAYRASDRVSQFLIKHVIYEGDQSPQEVFFRTILFKLFNKIETWEMLQGRLSTISYAYYSFQQYDDVLTAALASGARIYSAAYMMPSGRTSFGHTLKHRNHLFTAPIIAAARPLRQGDTCIPSWSRTQPCWHQQSPWSAASCGPCRKRSTSPPQLGPPTWLSPSLPCGHGRSGR